jgi:hypothetical protein
MSVDKRDRQSLFGLVTVSSRVINSEPTLAQFEKRTLFRVQQCATARHAANCFAEAFLRLGTNFAADSIHFRQEAFELDTR